MNPFFSIIIPAYNSEDYIAKNLSQIRNQNYDNYEVIIINDGSTDKTEEICLKFTSIDHRFILHSIPNGGVSAARNIGLELSKGKYIWFCDSDDYISDDSLQKLYNIAFDQEVSCIFFDSMHINDGGEVIKVYSNNNGRVDKIKKTDIDEEFLYFNPKLGVCDKIFKKEHISQYFLVNIRCLEDLDFWYKFILNIEEDIIYLNKPLYCYRESIVGISREKEISEKNFDVYHVLNDICNISQNKEYIYRLSCIYSISFFMRSNSNYKKYICKTYRDSYLKMISHNIVFLKEFKFILFFFFPSIYKKILEFKG